MNRQRHATPNLYAARSAFLPYSSQAMFKKNFPVWFPRRSITYRRKPLLCKLFEHCAFAQRPQASKRCSESQSGSEITIFMIFMIFKILGFLMAELCLSIFHIHNASMTMRLSGNLSHPYPNSGL